MPIYALMLTALLGQLLGAPALAQTLRERLLRDYARDAGLVPPQDTWQAVDPDLVDIGQQLFESTLLSSEGDTACASCHLDRFGSSDGLPIAIGVDGKSFGLTRVRHDGDKLPRNALPFWGRGSKGFDIFFWDGRVAAGPQGVLSQFGAAAPSDHALTVAAHLPPLELGEMVLDRDGKFSAYEAEDVDLALEYAAGIVRRLREETALVDRLARVLHQRPEDVSYTQVMGAVATFITHNFRLQQSPLHDFVFNGLSLGEDALRGGLIFYGKGQCVFCHSGPYFSDFPFHTVAFPQFGHGFNGFGTDYGRYNVTQDPQDMFRFRTPPLWNVTKTAPYSHSGSVPDLQSAIRFHIDPLNEPLPQSFTPEDRQIYARRLGLWAQDYPPIASISPQDIDDLVAFLATLSFEGDRPVKEIPAQFD